ncbi:hypothetical protein AMAG_05677 [Allomyces macrogynus ATCC 38327]|uniref:F-box domain-containing protein n=1 Tax=Allomyces macrogynus (strain ATCC 38327) TaxID=578462 RepID=A0A0L0SCJ2_ALLM3|nr:hypothetical protein AMAG_05677 [Allomyces macrogynus ATCC 38327]|eukprot:KNE60268.1 hypothetical protein AMAG_05677 [Allomyces macrogynus ATCC 38327]
MNAAPSTIDGTYPRRSLLDLPIDVLHVVCKFVNRVDRASLAQLALTGPSFFVPAIRTLIAWRGAWDPNAENGSEFHTGVVVLANDRFRLHGGHPYSTDYRIGTFAVQVDAKKGGAQVDPPRWFLFLPPRDAQRVAQPHPWIATSARAMQRLSFRWSLLSVPVEKLQFFTRQSDQMAWFVPPRCRAMCFIGYSEGTQSARLVPDTIRRLELKRFVFPGTTVMDLFFGAQPARLRELIIDSVAEPGATTCGDDDVPVSLFCSLPSTLRRLSLSLPWFNSTIHEDGFALLVRALPTLVCLESFALTSTYMRSGSPSLKALARALRKVWRLRELVLDAIHVESSKDLKQSSEFMCHLPLELDKFSLTVRLVDILRRGELCCETPHALALPPPASELTVFLPPWRLSMAHLLSFPSALSRLCLHGPPHPPNWATSVQTLNGLLPHLPHTLIALDLSWWMMHDEVTVVILGRHWPPRLTSLRLHHCYLTLDDVALLAQCGWPPSLTRLDLSANKLADVPGPLPLRLRTLVVGGNPLEADTWLAHLPRTVECLDLRLLDAHAVRRLVRALIDGTAPRPGRVRMSLRLDHDLVWGKARGWRLAEGDGGLSDEELDRLKASFCVG